MMLVRAMVVMALTACAPAAATPPLHAEPAAGDPFTHYPSVTATGSRHFGPPGPTSEAWPWKVGQYVVYKRRHTGGVALEQLSVVAQDSCGFWIERWIHENGARTTWLFCVRAEPSPDDSHLNASVSTVIERRNREVVLVADDRFSTPHSTSFDWLASLVYTPWPGRTDLLREDVATPAGQFEQAAKVTTTDRNAETIRWSHPAVPLGGIVKEVASDHERVLVEFGSSNRSNAIVHLVYDLELAQRSFREVNDTGLWGALRLGFDSLGAPSDLNRAFGLGASFGGPVASSFDATADVTTIGDASYSNDPTLSEEMMLVVAGIRWFPLGRIRTRTAQLDMPKRTWLYGQADVGYANLWRASMTGDSTTVGRGVALGAKVGFVLAQGRDWALGYEIHDHFALLNADEGLRHSFGVSAFVQLFGRPMSYTLPW